MFEELFMFTEVSIDVSVEVSRFTEVSVSAEVLSTCAAAQDMSTPLSITECIL
jgi:hypothetical protein